MKLVSIGFGNVVVAARVVAILQPQGAPMKRLKEEAGAAAKLVDATQGRRTRSVIVCDSDHVILSAVQAETVAARLGVPEGAPEPEEIEPLVTPAADISIAAPLKKAGPGAGRKGG
jgi:hypothetical protein